MTTLDATDPDVTDADVTEADATEAAERAELAALINAFFAAVSFREGEVPDYDRLYDIFTGSASTPRVGRQMAH